MLKRAADGAVYVADNGIVDPDLGLQVGWQGNVFSLMGWGARRQLEQAGVGLRAAGVPQMWLCGEVGQFPAVYQRLVGDAEPSGWIVRQGRPVGAHYVETHAEYCLLTGILPPDAAAPREIQAAAVFEGIEDALRDAGMTFGHVVRTWLYMDDILDWYDPFNQARDAFFRSRGVYDGLVPASTGIGSANLYGTAMVAAALAVKPLDPLATVLPVTSPLQCAALEYGSSFSRAVEIGTPEGRMLLVSGTASIEPGGRTAYVGDVERQIQLTMDVVGGILTARGMGWGDATRAIMYLKQPEFLGVWDAWRARNGLQGLPVINMVADVCRDDLLVELELDAVRPA